MTKEEYFKIVEEKDILHKKLEKTIKVSDDNSSLVSLMDCGFDLIYEPSIMKDYRFLVREALVEKIGRISKLLNQEDKTLIIRSTWRSFKHQRLLWERSVKSMVKKYPDKSLEEVHKIVSYFIAPERKSTHSTGGAVDALIFDQSTKTVLDFGTNKGMKIDLGKKCYPYHPEISEEAKRNRSLLIKCFEDEDFVCDMKEYWHFDYGNIGWAIEKAKDYAFYGIKGT